MKRFALLAAGAVVAALLGLYAAIPEAARAQKDDKELAGKVRDILLKNCSKCHGSTATSGVDIREYKNLIAKRDDDSKLIEPKKLDDSLLWSRVGVNKDMPPKESIPEEERKTIEAWIKAGAPEWPATAPVVKDKDKGKDKGKQPDKDPARPFVSTMDVLSAVVTDLREVEKEDKPYQRYFTLNHLSNNPAITEQQMRMARAAVSKVLNSMHWRKPIVIPRQVDKAGTVYAIDLRDLDWDKKRINGRYETEDRWAVMMKYYFYGMVHSDRNDPKVKKLQGDLDDLTNSGKVIMRGDWFVARATRPPIYERVLRLPDNAYDLEEKLGVNVLENLRRNRVARSGYKKSFVSAQNRLVERHDSLFGAYWKSYDFKRETKKGDLMTYPLGPTTLQASLKKYSKADVAFEQDGGEMIFNLPNGMQAYFLVNGKDKFIPKGPPDVVEDGKLKGSGTAEIINGLSCMVCHKEGMIGVPSDEVRNGTSLEQSELMQKVRFLYAATPAMNKLILKDKDRFQAAVKEAISVYLTKKEQEAKQSTWSEPIYELVGKPSGWHYHDGVTLETAAYELGYRDSADLKAALKFSDELNELGLRVLLTSTITRDEWDFANKFDDVDKAGESKFQRAAKALRLGTPCR